MKNLKTFEDYSDLDKQDKERAERNQISNFPHSAKEEAKKREKIEKRSHKEDPDGMYPRDDKRYDYSNDSRGGWQDGMGKPSWLGESVEDEDLILSLMKDKGWGDLSYNRIEDFKNSDYYKDPIDENDFVEQFDDYLYSQEDEEFNEEDSNIDLSIELENKLRILGDDSEMTVDDFLEEFGVDLNNMTGFAWAAILNGAEKYKGMSDEEFSKVYDEYKNFSTK